MKKDEQSTKQTSPTPMNTSKAWYRYPWVWFMISLPASAVVAGFITLYIASENAPVVINKQNRFQMEKNDGDQ